MKTLLAAFAGFITMFITNGLMAAVIIGPLLEERYREIVANPVRFPLLIIGYLIIAVAMALLYPRLKSTQNWLSHSVITGVLIGMSVFLGAHTVIAGYTTIDAVGWITSGLFDSIGPLVGMVTIGYIYHRSESSL
jgi:uncharacterized BrkB/YihY/UPF0761 family membrane protein